MTIEGTKKYKRVVKLDEGLLTRICDYLKSKFEDVGLVVSFDKNKTETFRTCADLLDFFERNEYQINRICISAGKETESSFDTNIRIHFFEVNDDHGGVEVEYKYLDDEDFIQAVVNKINGFIEQNSVWYGFASFLSAWLVSGVILMGLFLLALFRYGSKQAPVIVSVAIAIFVIWSIGYFRNNKLFPATQFWIKSNIKRQEKLSTLRKVIFGTVIGGTILSILGNIIWAVLS